MKSVGRVAAEGTLALAFQYSVDGRSNIMPAGRKRTVVYSRFNRTWYHGWAAAYVELSIVGLTELGTLGGWRCT